MDQLDFFCHYTDLRKLPIFQIQLQVGQSSNNIVNRLSFSYVFKNLDRELYLLGLNDSRTHWAGRILGNMVHSLLLRF